MTEDAAPTRPYRVDVAVEQWDAEPDGPPDRVVRHAAGWFEPDGRPIEDIDRIAELEARVAAQGG